MYLIDNFLSDETCDRLKAQIDMIPFVDGASTVNAILKNVKKNYQMDEVKGQTVLDQLKQFILTDQRIRRIAMPKAVTRMLVNRHDIGMEYGFHTDLSIVNGMRCDISFTIFLEEPGSYEGGELIVQDENGQKKIKGKRGSIFLYDAGFIHRVNPVTAGSRLACAGWIQSYIRDGEKRSVLRELASVYGSLSTVDENSDIKLLFRRNLLRLERLWYE